MSNVEVMTPHGAGVLKYEKEYHVVIPYRGYFIFVINGLATFTAIHHNGKLIHKIDRIDGNAIADALVYINETIAEQNYRDFR